jgi:outer membrane protein assembly factor BamB
MRLKTVLILIIFFIIITSYGSCSPNPKGLLIWDIDFKNDPDLSHYGMIFGENSAISGNLLVCVRTGGYMFGIDKNTGQIKWTYQGSTDFQTTPIIENNKIYNVSRIGTLYLTILNLSGSLIEEVKYDSYEGNMAETVSVYNNNKLYYGIRSGSTGKWIIVSIDLDSYILTEHLIISGVHRGRILSRNNTLFISYTNNIYSPNDQSGIIAYDLLNEEEKWKTSFGELNGISNYNPIIYNGKMYVQVQCYTKELDLETGEVLRTFIESCGNNGMSAVDNILFHPDWLDAFDLNTGELLWSQDALYTMDSGSVYHDGVFYVMFYGLVALDADNGKYLIKPNPHDGEGPSWEYDNQSGMPLLDDGVIYVNGLRGIYAFNTIGND